MGDFYVSTLLFRHLIFEESPCIPALFIIHERKFSETHQELFKQAGILIPSMKSLHSCIVTDRESAITKAIELELPNLHHALALLEPPLSRCQILATKTWCSKYRYQHLHR